MDFVDFTKQSGESLEYLYREEEEMDWPDFFEIYKERFPLLLYIVGGNYGETAYDDFCSDQIYRVQTYSNQRRIVAKAAKVYDRYIDIYLSIPISTEHKFCVLRGRTRVDAPKTLEEIVTENEFPIPVKFAPDVTEIYVGNSREDVSSYATILLTREYIEHFLLGNCVMNNQVCKSVTVAAISALISVAPVSGIKDKSAEFFRRHIGELQASLADVKFDRTAGNTSITLITPDGTGTGNILPKIDPPLLPTEEKPEPETNTKDVLNDSDDDNYEKPTDVGPKLPPRNTQLPTSKHKASADVQLRRKTPYENAAIVHPIPSGASRTPIAPPRPQKGSKLPQSPTVKNEQKAESTEKRSMLGRGPLPNPTSPAMKGNELFSEADYMYMTHEEDMYEELSSVPQMTTENDSKQDEKKMAQAASSSLSRGHKVMPKEAKEEVMSQNLDENVNFTGDKKLLAEFSVARIGEYLRKLRLDKYIDRFAENAIDGNILCELTKQELKEEYGFSPSELVRLWKFITEGYIPK